jgi:DNA polymerase-1
MCSERDSYWSVEEERTLTGLLKNVLENNEVLNQNYLYDAFYLALWFGIWSIPVFDTMFAQNVLQPGKEKKLGYLASIHCKQFRYWKDDGKEWHNKMDETVLWRYCCMDCGYTFEAARSLERALRASGLWSQFQFQMSLFEPVLKSMLRGVNTDRNTRLSMSSELGLAVREREQYLNRVFGHPVNPRSHKQLAALFYTDFKIPPIISRKTHGLTVDDDALDKIKLRDPLFIKPCTYIQQIRTLGVLKSTFVDAEGPGNRLYTSFNPAGTKTFRFSSSTNPIYWGTNAMNVPKYDEDEPFAASLPDIRKLYKPDPGYTWVKIDLSKADLHVVVWEAEEDDLKELLRKGVNIYKNACEQGIIKVPYHKAKILIHGTDYGGKPNTMSVNCKIPVAQVKQAQQAWFATYPGIKHWHERVEAELKATRTVTNKFGYRIFFFDRIDSVLPDALAWGPQSTVARIINEALIKIDNRFHSRDVKFTLQVHDELDLQVLTRKRDLLIPKILECFTSTVVPYKDPLVIPAEVEFSEKSWGELEKWEG